MARLSAATLDRLPADVTRPRYDRARVRTGIVHLGIGAFFRAQQAALIEDALVAGDHGFIALASAAGCRSGAPLAARVRSGRLRDDPLKR